MEAGISEVKKALTTLLNDNPIIFLDYDGTLVPIQPDADAATADTELLGLLKKLDSEYNLWIVTGRTLESISGFIGTDFNIVGLHGLFVRPKNGETSFNPLLEQYRPAFSLIMEEENEIRKRFPGVVIKDKGGSVSFSLWGMNESDVRGLEKFLMDESVRLKLDFYPGVKIYELRIPGINKGMAIKGIRKKRPAIIIGDDLTDEDAFSVNPDAITVKVGTGDTKAHFRVKDFHSVREILRFIASQKPDTS